MTISDGAIDGEDVVVGEGFVVVCERGIGIARVSGGVRQQFNILTSARVARTVWRMWELGNSIMSEAIGE